MSVSQAQERYRNGGHPSICGLASMAKHGGGRKFSREENWVFKYSSRYLSKSPPSGCGRRPRRSVWPVARSGRHEHQSSFFRRHDVSCLGHRRARCILRSDPSDQVRSDKTRRCGSCRTASPADFPGRAEVVCGRPRKCRRRLTYHYKVVTRSYRHDIASGGLPTFKTARQIWRPRVASNPQ